MAAGPQRPPISVFSVALADSAVSTWVAPVSESMKAVENVVAEIAQTNIPILIVGESGVGKEMLARSIHSRSRFNGPLTKIACASMTAAKLGQHLTQPAPVPSEETPDGAVGTLLFDEISDLDAVCQTSLLHALPDGDVSPATGTISARIISTTTRDLAEETRANRFRSELYYRINGVSIRLPPLRERKEDILGLAEFLLAKHAALLGRPPLTLQDELVEALLDHCWPGNIRELENVMRKMAVLRDDRLVVSELQSMPAASHKDETVEPRSYSLKAVARAASKLAERELIMQALTRTHWNRKRAAQELQVSYKSLLYKLKQIGIEEGKQVK